MNPWHRFATRPPTEKDALDGRVEVCGGYGPYYDRAFVKVVDAKLFAYWRTPDPFIEPAPAQSEVEAAMGALIEELSPDVLEHNPHVIANRILDFARACAREEIAKGGKP